MRNMYGTYRNKHNNREITIERMDISDCGTNFWYADAYDMFTERDLERNWDMISEVGTPKPAMTPMQSLRLQLKDTLEDCEEAIGDYENHDENGDYINQGWIEALTHAITCIDFIEKGGE